MISRKHFLVVAPVLLALLIAVGTYLLFGNALARTFQPPPTATPTPSPTPSSTPTTVPSSTPTKTPTKTPLPTNTPLPTDTPVPPTETPVPPTDTPLPPTDTPVPPPTNTRLRATSTPRLPTRTPLPPTDTPTEAPTEIPTELPVEVPADAPPPAPTDTPILQVQPPAEPAPTDTAVPAPVEPAPTQVVEQPPQDYSRTVNGVYYDAYVDAATKTKQYYHYTCEFDAAWVVLMTNGIDASLQDQIDIVGIDYSIEPYYEETANGAVIYGGDILNHYSGDYEHNFLARSTGHVIRRIFEYYGLNVTAVNSRESLQAALRRGELVWIKATADFKLGRPATWIMPNGTTYETVLGNDHAVVVMGYNEEGALIRDVLGPTSTNWNREYEYVVPWEKFMASWGQQQYDGLAVSK